MKHTIPIEEFWHDVIRFTKEYWFEIAVFCVFVMSVFAVGLFLFE